MCVLRDTQPNEFCRVIDHGTMCMAEPECYQRYIAAGNPEATEKVLRQLSFDRLEQIRIHVAENPNTPIETLADLAADDSPEVRLTVAENPHTPSAILEILCLDDSDDVRFGIAENYRTPISILKILAADSNPYIECRASQTLNMVLRQVRPAA